MIRQVVPLSAPAVEKWLEWGTYKEMGWGGVLFAVAIGAILFAIVKGKINIVSVGPNEAGIRELLGTKLWRIGPGPRINIEGFWKARKASTARFEIPLSGEVPLGDAAEDSVTYTWQYTMTVFLSVVDTKESLTAFMYRAMDLNRDNMENSQAVSQMKAMLKRSLRVILEKGVERQALEEQLEFECHRELLGVYGTRIEVILLEELVLRPQAEIARAIRNQSASTTPSGVIAGATDERPDFQVLDGGASAN